MDLEILYIMKLLVLVFITIQTFCSEFLIKTEVKLAPRMC